MGRSNTWGDLDLTKCGVWGDMVEIIMCAIFGDCRLRYVHGCSESPIYLMCRPYSTGHTTV